MMKILAHRGMWNETIPGNSMQALETALQKGYGIESDIRDYEGHLVISHNVADKNSPEAGQVFKMFQDRKDACFAVNIKADGLVPLFQEEIRRYSLQDYFAFDMSVPQMLEYQEHHIPFFTRQSEYEQVPVLYESAGGVWLDAFQDESWISQTFIEKHLQNRKRVCIVSPELHQRDYRPFWDKLRKWFPDSNALLLCTDYPELADECFNS